MNDISVLLNLTGSISFERANPLMDLVSGHGPYVFYDELSTERFPLVRESQEGHALRLLTRLRDLLENRRLSTEDKGGRIRLMILLDLTGSFLPAGGTAGTAIDSAYCFPGQRVARLKTMMEEVFKDSRQLLGRLVYTFIFVECVDNGDDDAEFYRVLAYDGCDGMSGRWLSAADLEVNSIKENFLRTLSSPSEEWELSDKRVREAYDDFRRILEEKVADVAAHLAKAGLDSSFRAAVASACDDLKTIGDVKELDFDRLFRTLVSRLIGLQWATNGDSGFIIFKYRTCTEGQRGGDELVLVSLLQLLGTMTDEDFPRFMGMTVRGLQIPSNRLQVPSNGESPQTEARLFVVDGKMNVAELNKEAMAELVDGTRICLSKLSANGSLMWAENKMVSYEVFSSNNMDSTESDFSQELNERIDNERSRLMERLRDLWHVPFFFGKKPGDWAWYTDVTGLLDEIYAFELSNDRPLYSGAKRITEKEMDVESVNDTYVGLRERLRTLRKSGTQSEGRVLQHSETLTTTASYLKAREKSMAMLGKLKEELKKEMVKLGFASITYRMAGIAGLVVLLCFSFHFFTGTTDSAVWTGAALAAVFIALLLAAMVSQSRVKSSISALFTRIHGVLTEELKGKQDEYVKAINDRTRRQNEADIRKRNIDELEEKLKEFERHNMQVDLWREHFANMEEELRDMLNYANIGANLNVNGSIGVDDADFHTEDMPSFPESICQHFRRMETEFPNGQKKENITCFLKHLDYTVRNN